MWSVPVSVPVPSDNAGSPDRFSSYHDGNVTDHRKCDCLSSGVYGGREANSPSVLLACKWQHFWLELCPKPHVNSAAA